jgi:plastocyanin
MNKALLGIAILLAIAVVASFILQGSSSDIAQNQEQSEIKIFILTGENFKFVMNGIDNPDINVKKGNRVRIEFASTQGFHDWVVDEFGASTDKISEGGLTSVEFVADKKGTFEYYCSVGQHRANGMKGNLVVE